MSGIKENISFIFKQTRSLIRMQESCKFSFTSSVFLRLVIVSVDRSALKGGITYLDAVLRLREFSLQSVHYKDNV